MQKFREYIYCDERKMNSYIQQIPELLKREIAGSYEKKKTVEGGLKVKFLAAGTTMDETQTNNYELDKNLMEDFINWCSNQENAINYKGETLQTEDAENLIIFSGKMLMPEMGENLELLNSIAKNTELFDMIPITDKDRKMMGFIKESDNIPVLVELDSSDYLFNCTLKKESIIGSKDDFLDNIGTNITIIGRVEKIFNSDEAVEVYDVTKETLKLNRIIRRKIDKESLKDVIVMENGPLVKVTPLIAYK